MNHGLFSQGLLKGTVHAKCFSYTENVPRTKSVLIYVIINLLFIFLIPTAPDIPR